MKIKITAKAGHFKLKKENAGNTEQFRQPLWKGKWS